MVSVVTPVVECVRHENIVRALLGTLGLLTQGSCTTTRQALKVHEISTWEASLGHSSCHHWAMTHCHLHSALQLLRCCSEEAATQHMLIKVLHHQTRFPLCLITECPVLPPAPLLRPSFRKKDLKKEKRKKGKKMQKRCSAVLENAEISGYINCSH